MRDDPEYSSIGCCAGFVLRLAFPSQGKHYPTEKSDLQAIVVLALGAGLGCLGQTQQL